MSIRSGADTPPMVDSATPTVASARPTKADINLLVALHEAEIAARDLYDMTINASSASGDEAAIVALVREHHRAAGQALSGLVGKAATNVANADIVAQFESGFSGSGYAEAAHRLENLLVATHSDAVAVLEGTQGVALVASIVITEARQAVVMAELAGTTDVDAQLAGEVAQ